MSLVEKKKPTTKCVILTLDHKKLLDSLVNCTPQSWATWLFLLCPAATMDYRPPTTLTSRLVDRCHVTVNLHCTYVTFHKLHCSWFQTINTSLGNWMLIGRTIDQSPEKIVIEWFDDPSHIDEQVCRKTETIAIWSYPFIIIMTGCLCKHRTLSCWANVFVWRALGLQSICLVFLR